MNARSTSTGHTAILAACDHPNLAIVQLLAAAPGINPTTQASNNGTVQSPLSVACQSRREALALAVVDAYEAYVRSSREVHPVTPEELHSVVKAGMTKVFRRLLAATHWRHPLVQLQHLNSTDALHHVPLLLVAAEHSHVAMVRLLVRRFGRQLDINRRCKVRAVAGTTLFHLARGGHGRSGVTRYKVINKGGALCTTNKPHSVAVAHRATAQIVQLLLKHCPFIDLHAEGGAESQPRRAVDVPNTPLHVACMTGSPAVAVELLKAGAWFTTAPWCHRDYDLATAGVAAWHSADEWTIPRIARRGAWRARQGARLAGSTVHSQRTPYRGRRRWARRSMHGMGAHQRATAAARAGRRLPPASEGEAQRVAEELSRLLENGARWRCRRALCLVREQRWAARDGARAAANSLSPTAV